MSEYKPPKAITDLFKIDPFEARVKAVEWMSTIHLKPGDVVWMPNAETGEPERWESDITQH
jgi:hypothetical protein